MIFSSYYYLIFLAAVYLIFWVTGQRFRWIPLLLASFAFYAALDTPYLLIVLGAVTITTYFSGLYLSRLPDGSKKALLFWGGVSCNLLILATLKYQSFLVQGLNFFNGISIPVGFVLVSIGVSYFVFQAISYLSDIYLEITEPETHFGYFALYLAFFPKLLQGPIERANDLLPQLKAPYVFNYDNMRTGLLLFAWGLFKKVVVADRVALIVNTIYNDVPIYSGFSLVLATYLYAIQIYSDFSGYTDMALGTARLFNIRLTQNFVAPYFATSVADFWRRWHISFSSWILDYIFKPLQMHWRDWRNNGTALALIITFIISGVWHGATWGFIVWGLLHGVYLALSVYYKPFKNRIHKKLKIDKNPLLIIWQTFITFNLVSFAWIFFRSETLKDAIEIIKRICTDFGTIADLGQILHAVPKGNLMLAMLGIIIVFIVDLLTRKKELPVIVIPLPAFFRWSLYYCLVISIIAFGNWGQSQFLYFQF